jgi:SAM-dependent methyltransferase
MAEVGTNDVVYDLGSGDGRIAIAAVRDFGARRAVGIELNPQLVQESREKAFQAGVAERVQFIHGDLFTNDFSPASVVVLYLGHAANIDMRAKLVRTLKPGARVVSHQFGMGEWAADKVLDVRSFLHGMTGGSWHSGEFSTNPDVPGFVSTASPAGHDVLSAWIVPAPVAGIWRGKVRLESEEREFSLTLLQRLSEVSGSFQLQGPTNLEGNIQADLWGDHLHCWCTPTNQAWGRPQMWVDGDAKGDTIRGNIWVSQDKYAKEAVNYSWVVRRDKADLTGTWEWPGPFGSPMQLKIERRDGRLAAICMYTNAATPAGPSGTQLIPVADLYDFGGGFYFTLFLGNDGHSPLGIGRWVRAGSGSQDGWLVGEAMAQDSTLRGTIAFYPAAPFRDPDHPGQPDPIPTMQVGRRDWQPKRIAP